MNRLHYTVINASELHHIAQTSFTHLCQSSGYSHLLLFFRILLSGAPKGRTDSKESGTTKKFCHPI